MSDPIYIDFNEEYRRAKRNVLFWASTTIVLVIGTITSGDPIVTSWAQNIKFSPVVLVLGSWSIMIFMCVDFWHANNRLQVNYNPLKATIVEKGTVKNSSELANQFAGIRGSLGPISDYFKKLSDSINNDNEVDIVEINKNISILSKKVESVINLENRLGDFASSVDNLDRRVRRIYYVGFTFSLCAVATVSAGVRVFCTQEIRQDIAHTLHIERIDVKVGVAEAV